MHILGIFHRFTVAKKALFQVINRPIANVLISKYK